jgi:RNA polymerase sigma factor (sigma-70 family)
MPHAIITELNIAAGICSKIKANDERTLRQLYTHNYPKAEKYLLNNSGSVADAKDIYQEAFLAMWRNVQLDRFTAAHENAIDSYLFRIVKNKWLDKLREQKRKKQEFHISEPSLFEAIEDDTDAEKDQYFEQLKLHYGRMGSPCKELLNRFYFKKDSLREIASFFSWTEATAKNNKYRCLQKLKAMVQNTNR